MGTSYSKKPRFEHADIFIEIKNPVQIGGQRLEGVVHLSVRHPWHEGDKLWLITKGKEKVKWVEHETVHDEGRTHTRSVKRKGKRTFLEHR